VTAECRTRRVNWPARWRRAGLFNEDFNIFRPVRFDQSAGGAGRLLHYRLCWLKSLVYLDAPQTGIGARTARFLGSVFPVQRICVFLERRLVLFIIQA
jgi:hypothetical protein